MNDRGTKTCPCGQVVVGTVVIPIYHLHNTGAHNNEQTRIAATNQPSTYLPQFDASL